MIDFEGPDLWVRRVGLIIRVWALSHLSFDLNLNDPNASGDASRRFSLYKSCSKICIAVKPNSIVTFRIW